MLYFILMFTNNFAKQGTRNKKIIDYEKIY